jgi:broad specificity phosphatase PhoE
MARKNGSITLWLIECGQTTWGAEGRVQGSTDLPLSPAGQAAVRALAAGLQAAHIPAVHHSADDAARETAHLLAGTFKARLKAVEELADPSLGLLEGLTHKDFEERFPTRHRQWEEDPLSLAAPDGEPIIKARSRQLGAVARLLKRLRGNEAAVVLHPIGLGLLRCWLADRPARDMHSMLTDRPAVERYALMPDLVDMLEETSRRDGDA